MAVSPHQLVSLDIHQPIWDRFFSVAQLVVIGTREADGGYDFAPKHRAVPLGSDNYFGFVCTPRHCTYQNAVRERAFTVSFLHPNRVLAVSLAAAPRDRNHQKPALGALSTRPATAITGRLLADATLGLECELLKVVDGFGDNSLIAGKIVAAQIDERALRTTDEDDQDAGME